MAVVNVTSENFENEVLNSEKPVLIDFWASWCGPCKMLSPIVDEVSDEIDDIKFCKVNVDEQEKLAVQFQVMSIPLLVLMKNGKIEKQSVGYISREKLLEFLGR